MIDFSTLSPYFQNLRANLNDDITLTIADKSFCTNRLLLISHSLKLKESFGNLQTNSFTITDDIDPYAFGAFIEFVNQNKIDFNKYGQIDKLYHLADFYQADLFRDYLVMSFNFIDYQFNQISIYENQGKPTQFLIEKLSERIVEVITKWDNVHKVDLERLLLILKKADLSQFSPKEIFDFCLNAMKFRGAQSVEILRLFNLSNLPYDDLLKLQNFAIENNIPYNYFVELNKIEKETQSLQNKNANLSTQLKNISKNKTFTKPPIEFRSSLKPSKLVEIQAFVASNQDNVNFISLIIGKEKVGKTALINKYYIMKSENKVKTDSNIKNQIQNMKIDFLDFPDNEALYETIYAAVFRVQIMIFVCSPDIKGSVKYCSSFYEKALDMKKVDSIPSIIYWNKSDLDDPPVESLEEAQEFAKKIGTDLISVSAKTGENVASIYDEIISKLIPLEQKNCSIC